MTSDAFPLNFINIQFLERQVSPNLYTMYSSTQSSNLAVFFFIFFCISKTVTSVPSLPLPAQVVYQFPNPTWVENLAIRSNGEILVTLSLTPDVYLIDPSGQPTATLVHSFSSVLGLTGITEVEDDVFYIIGANISIANRLTGPGTYSIWELNLRSFSQSGATARKVIGIPEALFLDGAATLSKEDKTILLGDAGLGGVWKLNVHTGAYSFLISDPILKPIPTATFPIGINGLKVVDSYLYFTNTNQGIIGRYPISTNGTATGEVEVLANLGSEGGPDDLTVDCEGRVWIAQNTLNEVSVLLNNGTVVVVVGATDQLTVPSVTALRFGRTEETKYLLYCTTAGGLAKPVNGTLIEGGKVVVVDTKGF